MKNYFLTAISVLALAGTFSLKAQQTCDTTGNLIIFSNYDGGDLRPLQNSPVFFDFVWQEKF